MIRFMIFFLPKYYLRKNQRLPNKLISARANRKQELIPWTNRKKGFSHRKCAEFECRVKRLQNSPSY
jgi:hypothetical protein